MKLAVGAMAMRAVPAAWPGPLCLAVAFAVPAIDEVAVIVLAVPIGSVASWAAKRRR